MLWIELTRNGRVIASNIDNMKNDGIIAPHKEELRLVEIKSHPVVDLIKEGDILHFMMNVGVCNLKIKATYHSISFGYIHKSANK